jgi:CRP/FNR family cyclic AMP-dependent transcriptional regulator
MSDITTPVFANLDEAKAKTLFKEVQRRPFPKNSFVIHSGDQSDWFYLILSGRVKIVIPDEEGKEVILSILGPGDHFGEFSLIDGQPRSASVVTMEESTLLLISKDRFRECLDNNPDIAVRVMVSLTHRLRDADRKIEGLALRDVYSRLARTLSELAKEREGKFILPQRLTHQDLANMIGSSREMITRILSDLSVCGYISVENREITLLKKLPQTW